MIDLKYHVPEGGNSYQMFLMASNSSLMVSCLSREISVGESEGLGDLVIGII